MLELLTNETAIQLARVRDPLCVSLVFPTAHGRAGVKKARVQMKNLIAAARDEGGEVFPVNHGEWNPRPDERTVLAGILRPGATEW